MGMANAMKTMKIIGTALLMKKWEMTSLSPYLLVMVSPGLPGRSGECVDDHSIGNDESYNFCRITVNSGVDNRGGHGQDALKQDCSYDHVGNAGLVDAGAADENGGDCGECHEEGAVVERNEPIALFIQENADGSIDSRQDNRSGSHPVDADSTGAGVVWIRTDSSHRCSGLGVKECPHEPCHECKKQDSTSRNHEIWTDVNGEEIVQNLVPELIERNSSSEARPHVAPDHRRTVIGQDQPHYAHEGNRRETNICSDHHLIALDMVQQKTISPAEYQCKWNGYPDSAGESRNPNKPQFNAQRGSQQSSDNTEWQTKIQSTTCLHHRNHGEYQDTVHTKTNHCVLQRKAE